MQLTRQSPTPVELLAGPVLWDSRYDGRPIYFSDFIVRRDSRGLVDDEHALHTGIVAILATDVAIIVVCGRLQRRQVDYHGLAGL